MKDLIGKYWNAVQDYEDYYKSGFKSSSREEYFPDTENSDNISSFPAAESDSLKKIEEEISVCRKCSLCEKRNNTVPGEGVINPLVVVIGEGPGADEDMKGKPFVGAAGQYLDKWLQAISLDRKINCYIANVVKCRPPGNRDPETDEIEKCLPYLERQIALLKPKAILTTGRISSRIITGEDNGIGKLRGRVHVYKNIPVVATYHPSAVLRDRSYRAAVWDDLKILKACLPG